MPDTLINCRDVLVAVAESLETMAFISLLPTDPAKRPPPPSPRLYRITYSGAMRGKIELAAGDDFGRTVAAGFLGTTADNPACIAKAEDAVKELMNVTAGALLRQWEGVGPLEISLPMAGPKLTDTQWQDFAESDDNATVDADGCLISVRIVPG